MDWKTAAIMAVAGVYVLWPALARGVAYLRGRPRRRSLVGAVTEVRIIASEYGLDWTDQLRPLVTAAWELESRSDDEQ